MLPEDDLCYLVREGKGKFGTPESCSMDLDILIILRLGGRGSATILASGVRRCMTGPSGTSEFRLLIPDSSGAGWSSQPR